MDDLYINEPDQGLQYLPIRVQTAEIPAGPANLILDYVGLNSWSAIAGTCRNWRAAMMAKIRVWSQKYNASPMPFAPQMYLRSVVRLHTNVPNTYEIQSMLFSDNYDWEILLRREKSQFKAVPVQLDYAMHALAGSTDAARRMSAYRAAMDNITQFMDHLLHHPPAALIMLDELIIELGKLPDNNIYGLGSEYHKHILQIDRPGPKNFASTLAERMITFNRIHYMDPYAFASSHKELISVMIAIICDGIVWQDDNYRLMIIDMMESTTITYPASAAAVERAIDILKG